MAKRRKKGGVPRELERSGALCLAFANSGVPRRDDRERPVCTRCGYVHYVGPVLAEPLPLTRRALVAKR